MTPQPKSDQENGHLRHFLRRYQPQPPPASRDLETQLMHRIQEEHCLHHRQRAWFWGLVGVLVLVGGGWGIRQALQPQAITAMEAAELEAFVADHWTGLFEESEDLLPVVYGNGDWEPTQANSEL